MFNFAVTGLQQTLRGYFDGGIVTGLGKPFRGESARPEFGSTLDGPAHQSGVFSLLATVPGFGSFRYDVIMEVDAIPFDSPWFGRDYRSNLPIVPTSSTSQSSQQPASAPIVGTEGNDYLPGTEADDTILGLGGDDVLQGFGGADTLDGGEGRDAASYANATSGVNAFLSGGGDAKGDALGDVYTSIEDLIGSSFQDVLFGNDSNNRIYGGDGDDTLYGWGGTLNELYGGDGVDNMVGTSGIDIFDGGPNTGGEILNVGDTVSYQLSTSGVVASLSDQSINTGDAAGDTYTDMEDLTGTNYADILHGDNGELNNLWGLAGDDYIFGYGGTDIMIGDAGADYLDGGDGADMVDYETADAGVIASLANPEINTGHAAGDTYVSIENMAGSKYDDELYGDEFSNGILGWPGNDRLYGGGGNDGLEGMAGADYLNGGDGIDTAGYSTAGLRVAKGIDEYITIGVGVTASLLDPSINTGDAEGDTYESIENLQGSTFADVLEGDNANNTIFGLDGVDTLRGAGGDDVLEGGLGADALFGGDGIDIASYSNATSGVSVSLDGSELLFGESAGDTFESIEGILGTAFDDVIAGDANYNILQGGAGNDTLRGRGGDDLLDGGAGADTIDGGDGVDVVTYENATAGVTVYLQNNGTNTGDAAGDILVSVEVLQGSRFNDVLHGFQFGSSQLRGGDGDDQLFGGAGDDILIGGAGGDVLNGGAGTDLASYILETAPVTVFMAAPGLNQGAAAGDTFVDVENLAGTNFGDILGGDDNNNVILGGGGDDSLYGGGGNDSFEGGEGADFFDGGDGEDVVSYANETEAVIVYMSTSALNNGAALGDTFQNVENLIGTSFADVLSGTSANNTLFGELGSDYLFGEGGDDVLEGGAGGDTLDGGAGFDMVSYSRSATGITFFMGSNIFNTGDAAGDTYTNMEGVLGSEFDDVLGGDNGDNVVNGAGGNDWLIGADGNDYIVGGSGSDVLFGGLGNDFLDGGDGEDVAYYREAAEGVTVNLLDRSQNTGEAAGDDYSSIENVWASDFGDTIVHTNEAGQVYGFGGDDVLRGNGGDDAMYGGRGADTIAGGDGADTFLWMNWTEDSIGGGHFFGNEIGDNIEGFESGVDRLFVSRFFFGLGGIGGPADSLANADPSFVQLITDGTPTSSGPAFIYDSEARTLSYDPDGTGGTAALLMAAFDEASTFSFADLWSA